VVALASPRTVSVMTAAILAPARLMASARPWRALVYLASGALIGAATLLYLPLVAAATALAGVPLAAISLGAVERHRLRLIGRAVPANPHRRPAQPGLAAWLRLRYSEAATWRELAYAIVFATVLWLADVTIVAITGVLLYDIVLDPLMHSASAARWVASAALCLPLIVTLRLATALAAGHAALVRLLLGGDTEQAVRDLTRSRAHLVDAYEVERRRIERDLHDGAQQRLVALSLTLGLARFELDEQPAAVRELIDRAAEQAEAALSDLRDLIRGIHPRALTDHGLAAAVHELADRSPVPVTVAIELPHRLPSTVESTAYFVIAEALANAVKHASATAITVTASVAGGRLHTRIHDNGTGGADPTRGTGLAGITARVGALDGTVTVSSPPSGTTTVHMDLPCSAS
jgi:signal transduction histidine kinase